MSSENTIALYETRNIIAKNYILSRGMFNNIEYVFNILKNVPRLPLILPQLLGKCR